MSSKIEIGDLVLLEGYEYRGYGKVTDIIQNHDYNLFIDWDIDSIEEDMSGQFSYIQVIDVIKEK